MVVHCLDPNKDLFLPKESDEAILGPEVPYLDVIRAMMYPAQCTRPDITLTVNVLAWYSSEPIPRLVG